MACNMKGYEGARGFALSATGTPFQARASALGRYATDGGAVPLQAALAALIKGQRGTAPPWALA